MTRLVARQCRLLSAPRGVVGAPQRLPVIVPSRAFASRKDPVPKKDDGEKEPVSGQPQERRFDSRRVDLTSYHQHQKKTKSASNKHTIEYGQLQKDFSRLNMPLSPDLEDSEIVPVNSATIIPASITAAKPEHFVDQITPIAPSAGFSKHNMVVFLVTPSFAPWLLDQGVFVEKALAKLYKHLPDSNGTLPKIFAKAAVVDRLPEAMNIRSDSGRDAMRGEFENRARQPPIAETGYEGVAYVVLPSKADTIAQPKVSGEIGCIDFIAHTHTNTEGKHYDRVRVPLANTVFQTGQPSTLISTKWEWSRDNSRLELQSRTQYKTLSINLSSEVAEPGSSVNQPSASREAPVLSIPLLPLTVPRQVDGHMGNIIRGIVGPSEAKMTASTELERVVPQYFKARGEPAQATSAWALVIPKGEAHAVINDTRQLVLRRIGKSLESLSPEDYEVSEQQGFESLWQQQPPSLNVMVQEALKRGARLHKVLSGGGGWGKKAGLLSLDPVPIGAPVKERPSKDGMTGDYESVDEFSTALKPVVEDGDFIQFFISTASPVQERDDADAFQHLKKIEETTGGHAWSWEFGVIPSTVDSIPGGSWQHTANTSQEMAVFRGSFGALTEGGLTLMRGRNIDRSLGVAKEDLHTTTVDVPFSRWSAVRLRPRNGVKTKTIGESSAKTMPLLQRAMAMLEDNVQGSNVKPKRSNNAGTPV